LPNLKIEILHSRAPTGDAERLAINLLAYPSFEAFGRYLEAANPFFFWMRFMQTAWAFGGSLGEGERKAALGGVTAKPLEPPRNDISR
jgi:hypothetical protein